MLSALGTLFAFLVALTLLITVHEFGHFWVARCLGVKVLRFSLGFGKPLFRYRSKKDTEYVVSAIPLGGYVKMLDEREGKVEDSELHLAFNRKPVLSRIAVVCAGPFFNFLFALFAYWLMYVIGITELAPIVGKVTPESIAANAQIQDGDEFIGIAGNETNSWKQVRQQLLQLMGDNGTVAVEVRSADTNEVTTKHMQLANWQVDANRPELLKSLGIAPRYPKIPAVVANVTADGPAARAGIQVQDLIVKANGIEVTDWYELVSTIRKTPKQPLHLEIERDEQLLAVTLIPQMQQGHPMIGIQSPAVKWSEELLRKQRYSLIAAWGPAFKDTVTIIHLTLTTLKKIVLGDVSFKSLTGPIGIAKGAGQSAKVGFAYYLSFLALVSISLGVLNLLPVPVLDGGHLLYYLIEFVTRKPLSLRAQLLGNQIGMFLLLGLMILAFYNDFVRLFG